MKKNNQQIDQNMSQNIDQKIQKLVKQNLVFEQNPLFAQRMRCLAERLSDNAMPVQQKSCGQKNRRFRARITAALAVLLLAAFPAKSAVHSIHTSHLAARQGHPESVSKSQKPDSDIQASKQPKAAERLSEARAVDAAASYVKIMYGISDKQVQEMQASLSFESSQFAETSCYCVSFAADSVCYKVTVDAENGSFLDISMEKEGFAYYQDNFALKKSRLRKAGAEAESIALQFIRESSVITDAYVQYKLNANGQVPHGTAVCLFDLADGDRIRISYSMAEDALWGAVREKGGAGHRDANVREGETRMFLELD
ncbi:MAG: hypothetical protein K2N87_09610 [Eubacterium sp.]|nr:hypothetical protein [Eubacterium sp.]